MSWIGEADDTQTEAEANAATRPPKVPSYETRPLSTMHETYDCPCSIVLRERAPHT